MTRASIPICYLAALGVLMGTIAACSCERRAGGKGSPQATAVQPREPIADRVGGLEASLFELDFPLTDRDGRARRLSELRGAPFVASMIYTKCTSICPRIIADLQALERSMPEHERARTPFVLFSLDPGRDTPEALRRFAAEHALAPSRWILLAAAPDDMRTLAAVLGVRFRPEEDGEIAHSAVIAAVDSGGIVRHMETGLQKDMAPLVSAIHRSH